MTEATSQGGTKYLYTYDSKGNPTSLKIKSSDTLYIDTGATYTANGAYVSQTSDQDGYSEQYQYENTTNSLGLKANVSELKVGFECSTSVEWDKYNTNTSYANVSVSGWALAMLYCFVTTGQPAPSPSYAYG